jgi:surface polysaccharide O-acyltransferase-like enzyme
MRKAWLDYLRVFALLAVITGHVVVDFYRRFGEVGPAEWWLSNILSALLRASVPIFVMVSGALLLGRAYTLGGFYKKRAVRLLPPIIFWNLVYLVLYGLDGMDRQTLLWTLKARIMVDGYVAPHLWYLSMFICLMIFVPFINKFIMGEKPTARDLSVLIGVSFPFFLLNTVASVAINIYDLKMDWFTIFPWFIVYFIAGYYIDNYSDNIRLRNGLIVTAILSLTAIGAGLNYYAVSSLGILNECFIITEMSPLVFLTSILVFLLAKNLSSQMTANKVISAIAEASFGMYLVHEIFNGVFYRILPDYFSHGLIYIPTIVVLTSVLSFITIRLLRNFSFMRAVC